LDDDAEHLPIAVGEIHTQQRLADAQMGSGADGEKFGDAFDDAQQEREKVWIQLPSGQEKVSSFTQGRLRSRRECERSAVRRKLLLQGVAERWNALLDHV
jgi:hypothetical protein